MKDRMKIRREKKTRSRKDRNGKCMLFNNNAVAGVWNMQPTCSFYMVLSLILFQL
jgi:hypothetical protein